ncbi:DUF5681 domain-containing protein, partial [Rhizorhabdus wittichii]|uniref:DUF5681 domain-containing protein n=1 Tax=Rhizorhabdus wittichii TaxID=160791 RepID=UPI001D0351CA
MANNPDYEVGWGRPPKHTQWKKGGPSPNPNGRRGKKGKLELGTSSRPKTARDQLSDEVLAELNSLVKIQGKDGKVEEITKYRAMFRKWVNEALTLPTSAASRKLLTDIAQQAAEDDLAAQQGWIDFLKGYKTAEEQKLACCRFDGHRDRLI